MTPIDPNIGQLGEVIYSVLPELIFQKLYGKGWVLMDGREIMGSALHKLTKEEGQAMTHIPNGIDMFIRGKTKDRPVGHFQHDTTRMPDNKFTTKLGGEHNHHLLNYKSAFILGHQYKNGCEISSAHNYHNVETNVHEGHTHIILGGDPETRPKNIALYIYIKIN